MLQFQDEYNEKESSQEAVVDQSLSLFDDF